MMDIVLGDILPELKKEIVLAKNIDCRGNRMKYLKYFPFESNYKVIVFVNGEEIANNYLDPQDAIDGYNDGY